MFPPIRTAYHEEGVSRFAHKLHPIEHGPKISANFQEAKVKYYFILQMKAIKMKNDSKFY